MLVTRNVVCCSLTLTQRGEHDINDELVFSNHTGYVFHDSRGIESGTTEEVDILQEFIQCKASERRLKSRLHAIWFVNNVDYCSDVHIFSGTASRWTTIDQHLS